MSGAAQRAPKLLAAAAALPLVLAAGGCKPRLPESYPSRREWRDRLVLFAGVEKLAVAPFRDPARSPGLDAEKFARLLADEIVPQRRFKLIYPAEVRAAAEEANRELALRLGAERRSPADDEVIDLARSEIDAVHAARAAGADAVLVAAVHDFEVYPPKRLAVTFRVYLCRTPQRSFQDILRMTDAGVPVEVSAPLRERFIWEQQRNYDTHRKGTRLDMTWHARKHERDRGFGDEVFYYSTEKFLTFVCAQVTGRLYTDSCWYSSPQGRAVASRYRLEGLGPGGGGGSGFGPAESDDGILAGGRGVSGAPGFAPGGGAEGVERR